MSVMRSVLLAGSQSAWLRDRATKYGFVRRAVSRFMPGERADDALAACTTLGAQSVTTIVTHLGENLTSLSEADDVRQEYLSLLQQIGARRLGTQVSVKLTQLGLDLDPEVCFRHLSVLGEATERSSNYLWIDMEASPYVDVTLDLYRRVHAIYPRTGVCLQAYLRRTAADIEQLIPLGAAIRLVKGAYNESADVAFQRKEEVDEQYYALATRLLGAEAVKAGVFTGIATHDPRLVARLESFIETGAVPRDRYEFEMLYGIQRGEQERLVRAGKPLRVLISYGEFWFPWFMRRLAERPANVWFVVKNLVN
ncbi:MAG: proline dehydrogenase family protein [Vicinamibacterales bacterium]